MKKLLLAGVACLCVAWCAQAASAQSLIISEFRTSGPNGANDEFVEIYNNSDTDLYVAASDGSGGYAVAASDGAARFTIPNGTFIRARGHYLGVNSNGYSLGNHPAGLGLTATGNATYTTDIPFNAGIALFKTANPANFTLANRLDAVGSTSEANTLYKEGAGYPAIVNPPSDYSFVRRLPGGCTGSYSGDCPTVDLVQNKPAATTSAPQDTNDNNADFIYVIVGGTDAGAGPRIGGPGPENTSSPIERGNLFGIALVDPLVASSAAPNRVRDTTPFGPFSSGTLEFRRRFTNNTGQPVIRLRFRIVDITTYFTPAGSGIADLRALSSGSVSVSVTGGGTVTVQGTTLDEPPFHFFGGGYNSALSVGTITLSSPLAAGDSVNVRFLLGVAQPGAFRFFVNIEALP
jgi:hypothetical protein